MANPEWWSTPLGAAQSSVASGQNISQALADAGNLEGSGNADKAIRRNLVSSDVNQPEQRASQGEIPARIGQRPEQLPAAQAQSTPEEHFSTNEILDAERRGPVRSSGSSNGNHPTAARNAPDPEPNLETQLPQGIPCSTPGCSRPAHWMDGASSPGNWYCCPECRRAGPAGSHTGAHGVACEIFETGIRGNEQQPFLFCTDCGSEVCENDNDDTEASRRAMSEARVCNRCVNHGPRCIPCHHMHKHLHHGRPYRPPTIDEFWEAELHFMGVLNRADQGDPLGPVIAWDASDDEDTISGTQLSPIILSPGAEHGTNDLAAVQNRAPALLGGHEEECLSLIHI